MQKKTKKNNLYREAAAASGILMLIIFLLHLIPLNFEIFKPFKEQFNDFDIYDMVYSDLALGDQKKDTSIVLVQIAEDRQKIAGQLKLLQKCQPAVIGVDVTFETRSDDLIADSILADQLRKPNVVTGNRLYLDSSNKIDVLPNFFDTDSDSVNSGYFNFLGGEISVVRYYPPFVKAGERVNNSFTSVIAKKIKPGDYRVLESRKNKKEIINYSGNLEHYTSFLWQNVDTAQLADKVKGKIVLLGVLYKKKPLVLEDLHFTPMNSKINGKSFPDAYGVVIHANILSMIFSGNYIGSFPLSLTYIFAAVISFFLVLYQLRRIKKNKHAPHWQVILYQFILIIALTGIFLFIFKKWQIKIPLSPIVLCIIISVELLWIYRYFAQLMNKWFSWHTIFAHSQKKTHEKAA